MAVKTQSLFVKFSVRFMDLLHVLCNTLHENNEQRKQAESIIDQTKGNTTFLLAICDFIRKPVNDLVGLLPRPDLVQPVRLAAAVLLKNSVLSVWRKQTQPGTVEADEEAEFKRQMKLFCLSQASSETDTKVANACAGVLGTIARMDFPGRWPTLLDDLLTVMPQSMSASLSGSGDQFRPDSPATAHRGTPKSSSVPPGSPVNGGAGASGGANDREQDLREHVWTLFLANVCDALERRVLYDGRPVFEQIAPSLFEFGLRVWAKQTITSLCSSVGGDSNHDDYPPSVETQFLALQILDQTLSSGFPPGGPVELPHRSQFFAQLAANLGSLFNRMVEISGQLPDEIDPDDVDHSLAQKLPFELFSDSLKLTVDVVEHSSTKVDDVVGSFVPFCLSVLSHSHCRPAVSLFNGPVIQCMELIKFACSHQASFPVLLTPALCQFMESTHQLQGAQLARFIKQERDKESGTLAALDSTAAPSDREQQMDGVPVWSLIWLLIDKFFLLTPTELHLWREDPIEFLSQDEADLSSFSVKKAADTLFLMVTETFETFLPLCLALALARKIRHETADERLLDGRLRALGIAAFELSPSLFSVFPVLLETVIVPCFQSQSVFLRKRVAWLCACCVKELPVPLLGGVYRGMIECMAAPGADLVVRATACNALYALLKDLNFQADQLIPLMPVCLPALFALSVDLAQTDEQSSVWKTIDESVDRCGRQVCVYADLFLQSLSSLWQTSVARKGDGGELGQTAVLQSLAKFVRCISRPPSSAPVTVDEASVRGAQQSALTAANQLLQECVARPLDTEFFLVEAGADLWLALFAMPRRLILDPMFYLFPCLPPLLVQMDASVMLVPALSLMEQYLSLPRLARRCLHEYPAATVPQCLVHVCSQIMQSIPGAGQPTPTPSRSFIASLNHKLVRVRKLVDLFVQIRWPSVSLAYFLDQQTAPATGGALSLTADQFVEAATRAMDAGVVAADRDDGAADARLALFKVHWQMALSPIGGPVAQNGLLAFCRLLVQAPAQFFSVIGQLQAVPQPGALSMFFDRWFDETVDGIRDLRQRKVYGLASAMLLLSPSCAQFLPLALNLVTDVHTDVQSRSHELVDTADLPLNEGDEVFFACDPAVCLSVPQVFVQLMRRLQQVAPDAAAAALANVDPVLMDQFNKFCC